MKDRIKKIRRHFDLTQREFGERIGVKANTIATYEMGRNNPIDSVVTLICREFHVNEEWLRNGEGEMLVPTPTSELDALAARYPRMTHETYVLIEKLVGLSESDQNVIMGFLREVVDGFGDTAPGAQAKPGVGVVGTSAADLHAELDRQLDLEKEEAGESVVA